MGASLSAHDATRTFDCATPGCDGEARTSGGVCDRCFLDGKSPPWTPVGRDAPAPAAVEAPREETAVTATPERVPCRIAGCDRPAEPRSVGVRGVYAKLCAGHREETRRKASLAHRGTPSRAGGRARPVKPSAANGLPSSDRLELARRLVAAAEKLAEAERALVDAQAAWEAASAAIAGKPA
jgi:hypothetical protein